MESIYVEPEPPSRRRRSLATLAALLSVLSIVVGIVVVIARDGEREVVADPVTLLSDAPEAAREAGSARMTMRMDLSGGDDGAMPFPGGFGVEGSGVVDFVTGDSSSELSMMGMSFEMRTVGGTLYMRMPMVAASGGKAWIATPAGETSGATPFAPSGAGYLDALRGISDEIEELGRRETNGVEANGYRVTIDVAAAIEAAPESQRADLEASVAHAREAGLDDMPMEVWVTDGGLPVRFAVEMSQGGMFDMRMQIDFTDFGVDVDVEAPPADEVQTVESPSEIGELFGNPSLS